MDLMFIIYYFACIIYKGFADKNPYEEGANITLAGIAYPIIKSEVYGFIG